MTKEKRKRIERRQQNKVKWNGNREIEDWTKVDEVFGNVFKNNVYWILRDKTTEIDMIKDKINEVNNEISELIEGIEKVSKMATNSKDVEKEKKGSGMKGSRRYRCSECVAQVFQCYLGGEGRNGDGREDGDARYLFHMEKTHKIEKEAARAYMMDFMKGNVQTFDPKKARMYTTTQMGKTSSTITMIPPPKFNESGSSTQSSLPATQPSQSSLKSSQLSLNLSSSLLDTSMSANVTTNSQFDRGLSTQDVSTQQFPTPSNTPAPPGTRPRPQTPGPVKRTRVQDSLDLDDNKRKKAEARKLDDELKELVDIAHGHLEGYVEDEYSGMSDDTILQATAQMRRNEACLSTSSTASNLSTGSSVVEVDKDYKVPGSQNATVIENSEVTMIGSPTRANEELDKAMKRLELANKTIVDKNNEIMGLKSELGVALNKVEALQEKEVKLKGDLARAQTLNNKLSGEVKTGMEITESDMRRSRLERRKKDDEIEDLKKKIIKLERELEDQDLAKKKQDMEKKAQEKVVEERGDVIKQLTEQNSRLGQKLTESAVNNDVNKKKVTKLEKEISDLNDRITRLTASHDNAVESGSQALQISSQAQAERDIMRKKLEFCNDPNCFDDKLCKRNHDRKSKSQTLCRFLNTRRGCDKGRDCDFYHPDRADLSTIGEEAMETDRDREEDDDRRGNEEGRRRHRHRSESRSRRSRRPRQRSRSRTSSHRSGYSSTRQRDVSRSSAHSKLSSRSRLSSRSEADFEEDEVFDQDFTDKIAQKAAKIMEQNWAKTNIQDTPSPGTRYGIDDYMVMDGKMVLKPGRIPSNSSSPGFRIEAIQGNYQSPNAIPQLPEPVHCLYPPTNPGPSGAGPSSGMRNQDFRQQGLAGIRSLPQAPESNLGQIQPSDPEIHRLAADQRLKEQQDRMAAGRRVQLLDVRNEASYVQMMNPGIQHPPRTEGRRGDQGYQVHGNQGQNLQPYNAQLNQVNAREQEELMKRNATFQDAYANTLRRNQGQGR